MVTSDQWYFRSGCRLIMHWPIGAYRPIDHIFPSTHFIVCTRMWHTRSTLWCGMYIAVTSSKLMNQCFADAPDNMKSYVSSKRIILLRLNVTTGQPRWTSNNC